jgi:hypothetical protein
MCKCCTRACECSLAPLCGPGKTRKSGFSSSMHEPRNLIRSPLAEIVWFRHNGQDSLCLYKQTENEQVDAGHDLLARRRNA